MTGLLERIALMAARHARAVFVLFALLAGLSVMAALRLEFDTDVLNLLPQKDQPVRDFREALETFGGTDLLLVVVRIPEGAPPDPYQELAGRLGAALEGLPELEYVEYRLVDPEDLLRTLMPQSLLFLDDAQRRALEGRLSPEGLAVRAAELRRTLTTPQSIAMKRFVLLDPLGISQVLLERVSASTGALSVDVAGGYYLSRDHRLLLLLAKPIRPAQDIDFDRQLVAAVEMVSTPLLAAWDEGVAGAPRPEIALGGGYVTALDDYSFIRHDVVSNGLTSLVVVLLLFLGAFRRVGPLFFAFLPLSCGVLMTFGFSWLVQGGLSSATSGVAALLIGLAIDFVIVSYGRYVEERRAGGTVVRSVRTMARTSYRAVVFGGITSAATFYAFLLTDFPGLRQMGVLAGTGILLCMVAVMGLLPALLVWREERHRRQASRPNLYLHAFGTARLMRWSMAFPRAALLLGLGVTTTLAFAALRLEFADSFKEMRSPDNRGIQVLDEVSRHFGTGFEFMSLVVRGESFDDVLELASAAADGAQRLVDDGVIDGYDALASFIPPPSRQREAVAWLEAHRAGLTDPTAVVGSLRAALAAEGLRPEAFDEGLALLDRALSVDQSVDFDALATTPETARVVQRYIRPTGDEWKAVVKLFPPPKIWKRQAPPECEALADELGPNVTLTGVNVVSQHLRGKTKRQAVGAAVLGLVLVALLLWLDFRRWRDVFLALAPLTLGVVWMLGLMALLGLKVNLMNIFVTTMIIGIGVDYGIHVVHRYRETEGGESFASGLLETGKAITMAALSTVVGFGSLALSSYPGLASIGYVAILGAVSTAFVAITLLPAFLAWRECGASKC